MKLKNYNSWIFISALLLCLSNSATLSANPKDSIIYKDSTTNSTIVFHDAIDIKINKQTSFERATIEYKKSNIFLYIMISPEKERFSWQRINDFDKGDKYGEFMSSEPLEVIEGYVRTYKKKNYYTQIALIRGNYYACYLVESCYDLKDFHLKEIVEKSNFSKATFKEKKNADEKFWIALLISFALTLTSILLKKIKYDGWFWFVVVLGIPISFCLFSWLINNYEFSLCIYSALILFLLPLGIWWCDSWKDFKNFLLQIHNSIH